MSRQTLNLVLLLLGVALTSIAADGSYRRFVGPAMFWPLVLAGVAVLALAGVDIVRDLRAHTGPHAQPHVGSRVGATGEPHVDGGARHDRAHEHGEVHDHDHDHVHCHPALAWGITVPVLLLLFVGPGPISARGADSALSGTTVSAVDGSPGVRFAPLPDGPRPEIGVLELTRRAAFDPANSVVHREVTVVGTVLRDGGSTRIGRVVVTCCAADARLVAVRVLDRDSLRLLASIPYGDWARVVVLVVPGTTTAETDYVPQVRVTGAERIEAPARPYERPAGR